MKAAPKCFYLNHVRRFYAGFIKLGKAGVPMYERMLDKQAVPTLAELTAYCGETAALFASLNRWLLETCGTVQKVAFPYGKHYGWGVSHKIKQKLITNIFAEDNAFTVMMRLSDGQYQSVYGQVRKYAQQSIDQKYPCGDGGWIHYRVTCQEHFEDIQTLLAVKCSA